MQDAPSRDAHAPLQAEMRRLRNSYIQGKLGVANIGCKMSELRGKLGEDLGLSRV